MRNYISLILLLSITFAFGQEGVVVPARTPFYEIESGTYKKDLNGELDPYTGTWEGTWEGKRFTLHLEKKLKTINTSPSGFYYYDDRLIGKYRVTNLTNNLILEDNLAQQDISLIKIESTSTKRKDNEFYLIYMDKDLCSNTGRIKLIGNPSTNLLEYFYFPQEWWKSEGCPYSDQDNIPVPIPTAPIVLTRIP